MANDKVLLVDDEQNVLDGFSRVLRGKFHLRLASGPEEGLEALSSRDPFAVVVSDMRMPKMNGAQFLAKVREISPNTVRMILTGHADVDAAIKAVNDGRIFRFLTKPCPPEVLIAAIDDGIRQYELVTAEKEILEKTLSHSIKALIDILSSVNTVAFSSSARIRRYARYMADVLKLEDSWRYELAAMLSQIGCVTVPPSILEKIYADMPLTDDEQNMFATHPAMGGELIQRIPRLEITAGMIKNQHKSFSEYSFTGEISKRSEADLGGQILTIAIALDKLLFQGNTHDEAIKAMLDRPETYDRELVKTLAGFERKKPAKVRGSVHVKDLTTDMVIAEKLSTINELQLASRGQQITAPLLQRIKNFWREGLIGDEVRVILPKHDFKDGPQGTNPK